MYKGGALRQPFIVANWKMNTELSDAIVLAQSVKNGVDDLEGVEIVLCPPYIWLYPVAEAIEKVLNKKIKLGAQNLFWEDVGAYTGEISGKMLSKLCQYVIVGHSERRHYLREDDEEINNKVHAALRNGLKPIVCVGEQKKSSEAKLPNVGRPTNLAVKGDILHQLSKALEQVSKKDMENAVIAYEPVWAISKGTAESRNSANGAYVASVINQLREKIFRLYDWDTAQSIRIIYGGSVDAENIKEYICQPEIDGVLVGGASLKAKEFIKICEEMAR